MIQQLFIPALIALAVGLLSVAVLSLRGYLALKRQIRELETQSASLASLPEKMGEIREQLEKFRSRVDELEKRKNVPLEEPVTPLPAPVSLNRRGQVMRLHRSGESASAIASAFGVSQGEVKLMVKVQELLAENASRENSPNFL